MNIPGINGSTALIEAAKRGYVTLIESTLRSGAGVNSTDYGGKTALLWAAQKGRDECVNLLIE